MLYDDTVLLTYGVGDRWHIPMFPAMKISRFMVNKMMAFKGIIFRQSWYFPMTRTLKYPFTQIPDDAGPVGQPGKFEHLSLIKIITRDFLCP